MVVLTTVLFIAVGVTGVFFTGLGCFLGFSPFIRSFIKEQIKGQTVLKKGTEQYERWEELPFPLQFNVYIFNVTNPDDVVKKGAKPMVQEFGPFVYNQYFHKKNIQYSIKNDTLSYSQFIKLEFDKEKSPYKDDQVFTVLNLPLQGVFQNEEPGLLPYDMEILAVNDYWKKAFPGQGIFVNITPRALFFDGLKFCCFKEKDRGLLHGIMNDAESVPVRLLCNQVKKVTATNPTIISDDYGIRFSFFAHKHNHADGLYEISAGQRSIDNLGQIVHWEHSDHMNTWDDPDSICNKIEGTDSAIYAPFNNDSSIFRIYNTDICKSITLRTKERIIYKGIHGIKATMGIENFSNEDEHFCNCIQKTRDLDGELECFPNGLVDLYNCVKAPVIGSFPHLMWADQRYRDSVDGLKPDEDKHTSFVAMEPNTGTPLQGRKRVQFNAILRPIANVTITYNLTPALVPVIWVEESFDLPDHLADFLKQQFINKMTLVDVVTFTSIGAGVVCVVVSVGFFLFPMF